MGASVYNSMLVPPTREACIKFFTDAVEKPLKGRNPQHYHPCCHVYSTRKKVDFKNSHPECIPFTELFKIPTVLNDNVRYDQAKEFYDKECKHFGSFPESDTIGHRVTEGDLVSGGEETMMEIAKSNTEFRKKMRALSEESANAKDLPVANPRKLKFKESIVYANRTVRNQISKLRVETNENKSLSRRLVNENMSLKAENERLSKEMSEMKKELAEQKETFKDIYARLHDIYSEEMRCILGKRELDNSSLKKEQPASDEEEPFTKFQSKHPKFPSDVSEKDEDATFPAN